MALDEVVKYCVKATMGRVRQYTQGETIKIKWKRDIGTLGDRARGCIALASVSEAPSAEVCG